MAFDFGEVLAHAWRITWKHKVLWIFGMLSMLLGFLFLPVGFAPLASVLMAEDVPIWLEEPAYILAFIGLLVVWVVASFLLGVLLQAGITYGVLQAEQGTERLVFMEVLRASGPYFGRFLGVMALLMGGVALVMLAYIALQVFVTMLTFGLGAMCMAPLQFLMYPLMFVTYSWLEQSLAAVVVDDFGTLEAVRRGWEVFQNNLLPVLIMTLILYLGVGMLSGFASIPLMVPFFALPVFAMEDVESLRGIFLAAGLCTLIYLPVLAVFQSMAMTFMKSGWMLTYLRLTRKTESAVEAAALT